MKDILENKRVITRKQHQCWGCNRKFPKGSSMSVFVSAENGNIVRSYWCNDCERVWDKYKNCGDEIGDGELIENYPEEYPASLEN